MKIEQDVCLVLRQCRVEGGKIFLPDYLYRSLYLATNKALEALGYKWDRHTKSHISADPQDDIEDKLALAIHEGVILGVGDNLDFFETPLPLIDLMFNEQFYMGIPHPKDCSNKRILEPSAGQGAILNRILVSGDHLVDAVEISPERSKVLMDTPFFSGNSLLNIHARTDFMEFGVDSTGVYDYIYMNPPFSKRREIDHVNHALDLLKPGGLLVTIMSPAINYRTDKKTRALADRFDSMQTTKFEIEAGAFKSSGTNVRTIMVFATKD